MRLTELIKLEEKVRILLKMQTNDYVPPACEFLIPASTNIAFKKPNGNYYINFSLVSIKYYIIVRCLSCAMKILL